MTSFYYSEYWTAAFGGGIGFCGEVTPPADKSISHRALLFSALAEGISTIGNLLRGEDVLQTKTILAQLGVAMTDNGETIEVTGRGIRGFRAPADFLYCGNSGTTMRLMMGLLAAQPFESRLTGDRSLGRRPMERVMTPLRQMGAQFAQEESANGRIIVVAGTPRLHGIHYDSPVASAQIKSAVLLAGLYADSSTTVTEPCLSRDHTERFLSSLGAQIERQGTRVTLTPGPVLSPFDLTVPGDPSSAAFLIVAALLIPNSQLIVKDICLNATRVGFIEVLKRMGASIEIVTQKFLSHSGSADGEITGSLRIKTSDLTATTIEASEVPGLIDEIPILALAMARAKGVSRIRGAEELRVKESDRLKRVSELLAILGVTHTEYQDGLDIEGSDTWQGGEMASDGDHRIAMTAAIAGLLARQGMRVRDVECVATSFPSFLETLQKLGAPIVTKARDYYL